MLFLDGPVGTELEARGVETTLPRWSAGAIRTAPDVLAEIHREYALAGASVHTTNTFRTTRRVLGDDYLAYLRDAVRIARDAVPEGHKIAGSIAPLEDCYRPADSPLERGVSSAAVRAEHREKAEALAEAGCDLLLCETFPHLGEAMLAFEAARSTGLPTWVSFCPGAAGDLLSPADVGEAAERFADSGAAALLINCVSSAKAAPFVKALGQSVSIAIGAYANAGEPNATTGWSSAKGFSEASALQDAQAWARAGASILGVCCGMRPQHLSAIVDGMRSEENPH